MQVDIPSYKSFQVVTDFKIDLLIVIIPARSSCRVLYLLPSLLHSTIYFYTCLYESSSMAITIVSIDSWKYTTYILRFLHGTNNTLEDLQSLMKDVKSLRSSAV